MLGWRSWQRLTLLVFVFIEKSYKLDDGIYDGPAYYARLEELAKADPACVRIRNRCNFDSPVQNIIPAAYPTYDSNNEKAMNIVALDVLASAHQLVTGAYPTMQMAAGTLEEAHAITARTGVPCRAVVCKSDQGVDINSKDVCQLGLILPMVQVDLVITKNVAIAKFCKQYVDVVSLAINPTKARKTSEDTVTIPQEPYLILPVSTTEDFIPYSMLRSRVNIRWCSSITMANYPTIKNTLGVSVAYHKLPRVHQLLNVDALRIVHDVNHSYADFRNNMRLRSGIPFVMTVEKTVCHILTFHPPCFKIQVTTLSIPSGTTAYGYIDAMSLGVTFEASMTMYIIGNGEKNPYNWPARLGPFIVHKDPVGDTIYPSNLSMNPLYYYVDPADYYYTGRNHNGPIVPFTKTKTTSYGLTNYLNGRALKSLITQVLYLYDDATEPVAITTAIDRGFLNVGLPVAGSYGVSYTRVAPTFF
jgi:hypothetical protein